MILISRALQSVGGGALQPLSQSILLESFPPAKRGSAMAIFALGVVVAPVLGPTFGGWLTDNYSCRAGQSVDITVDAFGTKYHGYIENLSGATGAKTSLLPRENATGNYVKVVQRLPVRIRLKDGEDRDRRLRPGMSVEPKVWLNTGPDREGP